MENLIETNLELLKRYFLYLQIQDILSCNKIVSTKIADSIKTCTGIVLGVSNEEDFNNMLEDFGYDELEKDTLQKALLFDNSK